MVELKSRLNQTMGVLKGRTGIMGVCVPWKIKTKPKFPRRPEVRV